MFLDNLYFQRNSTNANQKERVNSLIFLETDKMKNNQIHQNLSFFFSKKNIAETQCFTNTVFRVNEEQGQTLTANIIVTSILPNLIRAVRVRNEN